MILIFVGACGRDGLAKDQVLDLHDAYLPIGERKINGLQVNWSI